jgi:RimJ/RimL family protein N-acetyltransferase
MICPVKVYVRPDGRCFVRDPDAQSLAGAASDVYCTVDASEVGPYLTLGFDVHRREGTYVVPTSSARVETPPGLVFVRADEVDETTLRLLDDALRQDVPGTDGWRWGEAGFRKETYEAPGFDPTTYLVALDAASGEYVGIARVWMRQPIPRLGFIGVRPSHRRRGVARAMLAEVFAHLDERAIHEVSTEIDETNSASRALLEGLGARRTGTSVELIKRHS